MDIWDRTMQYITICMQYFVTGIWTDFRMQEIYSCVVNVTDYNMNGSSKTVKNIEKKKKHDHIPLFHWIYFLAFEVVPDYFHNVSIATTQLGQNT